MAAGIILFLTGIAVGFWATYLTGDSAGFRGSQVGPVIQGTFTQATPARAKTAGGYAFGLLLRIIALTMISGGAFMAVHYWQ